MQCIISIAGIGEYNIHDIQTCSGFTELYDGYAKVPNEMIDALMETHGFCEIEIEGDTVKSFTAVEPPYIPPVPDEPTDVEILQKENKLLKAQVEALSEQQEFLEDCLIEVGQVIYA